MIYLTQETERQIELCLEGVNNFVALGVLAFCNSTIFKCQNFQCFQGFVGSAHTRPLE